MYVDITFQASDPQANVGDDNAACIIGKVTSFSGTNRLIVANTLSELEAQGVTQETGGQLWKAASDFFSANGIMPKAAKLYAYAFDDAAGSVDVVREGMQGKIDGVNREFRTRASPVSDLTVEIQWTPGGEYIIQPSESAYVADTIASGVTTLSGEITFDSGDSLLVTPSATGVSPTYTSMGELGPGGTYPSTRIVASYTISGLPKILRDLREQDITMFQFAYAENSTGMLDTYSDDSWLLDCIIGSNEASIAAQAGKGRIFFFSLPKGAKATDTIPSNLRGTIDEVTYEELGNVLGTKYVSAIAHDALESSGVPINNVTGAYMGTAAGQLPLKAGITLQKLPISQVDFPLQGEADQFAAAKIAVVINMPDLYPTENLISYGHTFGEGTEGRIENIRCKLKIAKELRAAIFDFIRSHRHFVDESGCLGLNAAIRGLFQRLKNQQVCDGLQSITNPLLNKIMKTGKTAADKEYITFYVNRNWIPDIQIVYLWRGNPEFINIFVREAAI
jgi:hypothetical protein